MSLVVKACFLYWSIINEMNCSTHKLSFGSSFTFESRKTRVSLKMARKKMTTTINNHHMIKYHSFAEFQIVPR